MSWSLSHYRGAYEIWHKHLNDRHGDRILRTDDYRLRMWHSLRNELQELQRCGADVPAWMMEMTAYWIVDLTERMMLERTTNDRR